MYYIKKVRYMYHKKSCKQNCKQVYKNNQPYTTIMGCYLWLEKKWYKGKQHRFRNWKAGTQPSRKICNGKRMEEHILYFGTATSLE